jgi:hypothetical protein
MYNPISSESHNTCIAQDKHAPLSSVAGPSTSTTRCLPITPPATPSKKRKHPVDSDSDEHVEQRPPITQARLHKSSSLSRIRSPSLEVLDGPPESSLGLLAPPASPQKGDKRRRVQPVSLRLIILAAGPPNIYLVLSDQPSPTPPAWIYSTSTITVWTNRYRIFCGKLRTFFLTLPFQQIREENKRRISMLDSQDIIDLD